MFLSIKSCLRSSNTNISSFTYYVPFLFVMVFLPRTASFTSMIFLQVHWQETLRGYVAGVLTTHRVLIVSADLDILACSSTKFDKGLPSISLNAFLLSFLLFLLPPQFTYLYVGCFIYAGILNFFDTIDLFCGLGLHFFFQLPLLLVCLGGMAK